MTERWSSSLPKGPRLCNPEIIATVVVISVNPREMCLQGLGRVADEAYRMLVLFGHWATIRITGLVLLSPQVQLLTWGQ